jgi:uncharacterized protein (TIGR03086 family)
MTLELLDAYEQTVRWAGVRVAETAPGRLHDPTPCPDWDVLALLDHMVAGLVSYTMIAVDGRIDFDGLTFPNLPTDYVRLYHEHGAGAIVSWRVPGVLDQECKHPLGRITRRAALGLHHADLLLHGWDLAVATGQDAGLDAGASAVALDALRTTTPVTAGLRRAGYWGAEQPLPDAVAGDAAAELLAFSGRARPVA